MAIWPAGVHTVIRSISPRSVKQGMAPVRKKARRCRSGLQRGRCHLCRRSASPLAGGVFVPPSKFPGTVSEKPPETTAESEHKKLRGQSKS